MALKFVMSGSLRVVSGIGVGGSLHEVYTAFSGQTDFTLAGSYRPGTYELLVYVNGVRQTVNIDYQEIDGKTVRFLTPLEAGDQVLFEVKEVRNTSLHQEFVAVDGQTRFTLSVPYHPGFNSLQVYENGILLRLYDDYIEVDDMTVELTYPAIAGTKYTFREVL
jgi:hypothetical protein